MLDLDLLRSFVSVTVDGGFTRAGERVHRTQSTVSQQIKHLEALVGRPLLHRNGKSVSLTEEGERLLSYARRLLLLAAEARDAVARPAGDGVVRLGITEDFAAHRLTEVLSDFAHDVRSDLSIKLRQAIERGELDLALFKRDAGERGGVAAWPETLHWVTSRRRPIDFNRNPLPLAVAEHGCPYRNRAIHAAEAAGRGWYIAYTSPNLLGIQAAVTAGLGISILPEVAILPGHRVLEPTEGFPAITNTETALVIAPNAGSADPAPRCAARRFLHRLPIRARTGTEPGCSVKEQPDAGWSRPDLC